MLCTAGGAVAGWGAYGRRGALGDERPTMGCRAERKGIDRQQRGSPNPLASPVADSRVPPASCLLLCQEHSVSCFRLRALWIRVNRIGEPAAPHGLLLPAPLLAPPLPVQLWIHPCVAIGGTVFSPSHQHGGRGLPQPLLFHAGLRATCRHVPPRAGCEEHKGQSVTAVHRIAQAKQRLPLASPPSL